MLSPEHGDSIGDTFESGKTNYASFFTVTEKQAVLEVLGVKKDRSGVKVNLRWQATLLVHR